MQLFLLVATNHPGCASYRGQAATKQDWYPRSLASRRSSYRASSRYPQRIARKRNLVEVSRGQRRKAAQEPWLSPAQLQAWRAFMRVQMRMNYEMNRQFQSDSDLSLADYHVLNALTSAPGGRLQVSDLAALIGWERSRASHQLRRLCERGLAARLHPRKTAGQPTRS
jgi:Fic family protein